MENLRESAERIVDGWRQCYSEDKSEIVARAYAAALTQLAAVTGEKIEIEEAELKPYIEEFLSAKDMEDMAHMLHEAIMRGQALINPDMGTYYTEMSFVRFRAIEKGLDYNEYQTLMLIKVNLEQVAKGGIGMFEAEDTEESFRSFLEMRDSIYRINNLCDLLSKNNRTAKRVRRRVKDCIRVFERGRSREFLKTTFNLLRVGPDVSDSAIREKMAILSA